MAVLLSGVFGLVLLVAVAGGAAWVVQTASSGPQIEDLTRKEQGATSVVYAGDGKTRLGDIQSETLRSPISEKQMPDIMRKAVVAIEDRRFFHHHGVDYTGVLRAAIKTGLSNTGQSSDGTQGASTLTMQLIRNLYTEDSTRTGIAGIQRKVREARLAQELEKQHAGRDGKNWILTSYLNNAPFGTVGGQELIGLQSAARVYFRKSARDLTLVEAALLAGLPQAPSLYSPTKHPEAAKRRRNQVLDAMATEKYISAETAATAKLAPLGVTTGSYYSKRRESHFFDYVRRELVHRYGVEKVRQGGMKIYTTLDLKKQNAARRALAEATAGTDRSAAIATVESSTGRIEALASNARYGEFQYDLASQGNFATGSTFKTMVLMAAIHRGVNPSSTSYISGPLKFTDPKWGPIDVHTYSGRYIGRANLVRATLTSDNSIYQQLALDIGPENVAETAIKMGIPRSKLIGKEIGPFPSQALGAIHNGVSPLQMAHAYATIANGGSRTRLTAIRKVCFPADDDKYECTTFNPVSKKEFTDGETNEVTRILAQNVTAGTGTRAQIGCPAAGKTGTVDKFTDAWFVGYTPRLTTSVWVGHAASNYPLGSGTTGGQVAAPIWGAYMRTAKGNYCGEFPTPKQQFSSKPFTGTYSKRPPAGVQKPSSGKRGDDNEDSSEGESRPNRGNTGSDRSYPSDSYSETPRQPQVSPQAPAPATPAPATDADPPG